MMKLMPVTLKDQSIDFLTNSLLLEHFHTFLSKLKMVDVYQPPNFEKYYIKKIKMLGLQVMIKLCESAT